MNFFQGCVIALEIDVATVFSAWLAVRLWQVLYDVVSFDVTMAQKQTACQSGSFTKVHFLIAASISLAQGRLARANFVEEALNAVLEVASGRRVGAEAEAHAYCPVQA